MLAVYILFTLLLVLCEFLVVMFKYFSKPTNYERKMEAIEEIGEKRLKKLREIDSLLNSDGQNHPAYRNTRNEIRKYSRASLFN